jgi:hypothetical protein
MASDQTWTQYPQSDPTTQYPPPSPYPPMTQGPPTSPYGPAPYPPADGSNPTGTWGAGPPGPLGPSGPYPPQGVKKGPSAGLLVGLAALAVAVIGAIAFLLIHDDGDDTATQPTSQNEVTTTGPDSGGSDTTAPGDDTTTAPGDETTEPDGGTGDGENQVFVDTLADALESTGIYNREQAECAAQVMLDQLGVDRMSQMDPSDPFSDLSPEETQDLVNGIADCGFTLPDSGST